MQSSKTLLWLLTILLFGGALWWYSGSDCSSCNSAVTTVNTTTTSSATTAAVTPGFSVTDSTWNVSTDDNLRFGKSGSIPVFSEKIQKLFTDVVQYAGSHPQKNITVTGRYAAEETNNSRFENLGLARADTIKKWLVAKGIPALNIITNSQADAAATFSPADTLVGGISLAFSTIAPTAVTDDLFKPYTVYFATGQNSLDVSGELQTYLQQANAYLQTHNDKKLVVTGHTDNVGNPAKNLTLSAERAAFVKSQLVQQGITADKINSEGKGMTHPVADNNTAEGKAKNRRVTIQLQ